MIVIDKTNIEGKWIKYEDSEEVEFFVTPFKTSLRAIRPGDDLTSVMYRQARICLKDWKGIKDVNGVDIKYTEDNKNFILDHMEELNTWIVAQSTLLNKEIVNISKKKI